MGPYLAVPKKEKETENGENTKVRNCPPYIFRLNLELVECKAGEILWKTHISHSLL